MIKSTSTMKANQGHKKDWQAQCRPANWRSVVEALRLAVTLHITLVPYQKLTAITRRRKNWMFAHKWFWLVKNASCYLIQNKVLPLLPAECLVVLNHQLVGCDAHMEGIGLGPALQWTIPVWDHHMELLNYRTQQNGRNASQNDKSNCSFDF